MNTDNRLSTTPEGILNYAFAEPSPGGSSPAILLDRDGVINERIPGCYVTSWSEFRFLQGIELAIADLSRLNLPIIVVSNQAGVGKGLVSQDALTEITQQFVGALRARGARVDAVYYCPHVEGARCPCRKPAAGMLLQAAQEWHLNLSHSVLVGDSLTDLQAAHVCQCQAVFFAREGTPAAPPDKRNQPFLTVHDVSELVACVRRLLLGKVRE